MLDCSGGQFLNPNGKALFCDGPPSGAVVPLAATLIERKTQMIEAALAQCQGRVSGQYGAAHKLGIPRQTLDARILSLGINRHRFKTSLTDPKQVAHFRGERTSSRLGLLY
jgi:DNA-binding NtrC family response regulator